MSALRATVFPPGWPSISIRNPVPASVLVGIPNC